MFVAGLRPTRTQFRVLGEPDGDLTQKRTATFSWGLTRPPASPLPPLSSRSPPASVAAYDLTSILVFVLCFEVLSIHIVYFF